LCCGRTGVDGSFATSLTLYPATIGGYGIDPDKKKRGLV